MKIIASHIMVAAFCLCFFSADVFAVSQFTSASTFATRGSGPREIIKTPNGNIVLFYSNSGIKFRVSSNNGGSWSGESSVTTYSASTLQYEVASDTNNNLYIVYVGDTSNPRNLKISKIPWNVSAYDPKVDLKTFQIESDGSGPYGGFWKPSITIDKDGKLWVAYLISEGTPVWLAHAIIATSVNNGVDWDYNNPVKQGTAALSGDIALDATAITASTRHLPSEARRCSSVRLRTSPAFPSARR